MKLEGDIDDRRQDKPEYHQCQLFWVAYLQERYASRRPFLPPKTDIAAVSSQILAEFDFPSSGLGNLAGNMHLPLAPDDGMATERAHYQLYFLAMIAMRKLLNRILFHIYKRGKEYRPYPLLEAFAEY